MNEEYKTSILEQYENDQLKHLKKYHSIKAKLKDAHEFNQFSSPPERLSLLKSLLSLPPKERTSKIIEKIVELTKNLKFFQSLREEHSEYLHGSVSQYLTYEEHPQNSIVFKEGEKGTKFYVILEGKVRIFKQGDQELQELVQYSTGEKFGERALKYGVARAATVECLVDCVFCVLDKFHFKKIFDNFFDKKFSMLTEMMKTLPILNGQSNYFIQRLGYFFKDIRFSRGISVYKEGDPADEVYFIQEGEFRLTRKVKNVSKKVKTLKKKKLKKIEIASMTKYELFGDEEIFAESDIRLNSCYCNSNEGILYKTSKEIFLKHIIRNDEGYNVMKNRSLQKENSRLVLYQKAQEIHDYKKIEVKSDNFSELILSTPKKQIQGNRTPTNLFYFPKSHSPHHEKTQKEGKRLENRINYFSSYGNIKKFFGKPKEKYKKIDLTPVNLHTAKFKYFVNLTAKDLNCLTPNNSNYLSSHFLTEQPVIRTPKPCIKNFDLNI